MKSIISLFWKLSIYTISMVDKVSNVTKWTGKTWIMTRCREDKRVETRCSGKTNELICLIKKKSYKNNLSFLSYIYPIVQLI